jgi:hypothetical protein
MELNVFNKDGVCSSCSASHEINESMTFRLPLLFI